MAWSSVVSLSSEMRPPGASRATSWRMRNGVSVRWVAALTVVTSRRGALACAWSAWSAASRSDMILSVGEARS